MWLGNSFPGHFGDWCRENLSSGHCRSDLLGGNPTVAGLRRSGDTKTSLARTSSNDDARLDLWTRRLRPPTRAAVSLSQNGERRLNAQSGSPRRARAHLVREIRGGSHARVFRISISDGPRIFRRADVLSGQYSNRWACPASPWSTAGDAAGWHFPPGPLSIARSEGNAVPSPMLLVMDEQSILGHSRAC